MLNSATFNCESCIELYRWWLLLFDKAFHQLSGILWSWLFLRLLPASVIIWHTFFCHYWKPNVCNAKGKNSVMHLQYLLELDKFPLANRLLLKYYNLKTACYAFSLELNAQDSSEGKKVRKKIWKCWGSSWWHFQNISLILRLELKMWWQEHNNLSTICELGFGENCSSKEQITALQAN